MFIFGAMGASERSLTYIKKRGGNMKRRISLILAIILIVSCSGCFVGVEDDRRGYDNRDRGGHSDHDRGGSGEHDRGGPGERGPVERR